MAPHRRTRTIVLGVFAAALAGAAVALATDILAQLGLKEEDAQDYVMQGIGLRGVQIPASARKALRAAKPEARAKIAAGALTWLKAYTESSDFKGRYAELRETHKPLAPGSGAEQLQQMQDDQRKQLEEMKQSVAKMPPDIRKEMEKMVQQMEAQLNDPKQQAMARQIYEEQGEKERDQHQMRVAEWEESYPADPRAAIAKRLRGFLEVSAGVDYNAELVEPGRRGGPTKFADPGLEGKSEHWKLCYRAGKPAVDAVRQFVTKWLDELEKK